MRIFALCGVLLLVALPVCAQRPGGGIASRPHVVSSGAPMRPTISSAASHRVYGYGYGYNASPYYSSPYYGVTSYGFGQPIAYSSNPYPESANGGGTVIVMMGERPEPKVVYIPSYMRPSNGPSLAELAAQLKANRKPATINWSNVEKILPQKQED